MSIAIGDPIPSASLGMMEDGVKSVSSDQILGQGKVVLFSVPGAFTPTCSAKHLPGFVEHAESLFAKGIDRIACVSVNDVFVMNAWGKQQDVGDRVLMLADGNGDFARALGLEMDASGFGMGMRSKRFALVAENGVVTHLFVEEPGEFKVSSAEHVLASI